MNLLQIIRHAVIVWACAGSPDGQHWMVTLRDGVTSCSYCGVRG